MNAASLAASQEFERKTDLFLSGLSDNMPKTTYTISILTTPMNRHGTRLNLGNWEDHYRDGYTDMPFHPYCLEVYKRVSLLEQGHIDIIGLRGWYDIESDWHDFSNFPWTDKVHCLQEQSWCHEIETEYVVANPLFVPTLPALLQSWLSTDDTFSASDGAFNVSPEHLSLSNSTDPFELLPAELRLLILHHLASKEIANLRITPRSFRQLPISVWHHLLIQDMPWLWEAWPERRNIPYWFWATTSKAELDADPTMKKESMKVPIISWTNWHALYLVLKNNLSTHKGLRNRKRIWNDCLEIVRRIKKYKDEGKIPI